MICTLFFRNENDREKHKTINTRKKPPRLHFTKVNLNAYNTCIEMVGEPEYASKCFVCSGYGSGFGFGSGVAAIASAPTLRGREKHFRNFQTGEKAIQSITLNATSSIFNGIWQTG